jgi:hypothetical protein
MNMNKKLLLLAGALLAAFTPQAFAQYPEWQHSGSLYILTTPKDAGSTAAAGMIGKSRHFVPDKGVNCGDNITSYPYSDSPFTSEAWFRAEAAGSAIFGWGRYATRYNGNTGDGNEVVINIGSPASLSWSSDGPGGAVA